MKIRNTLLLAAALALLAFGACRDDSDRNFRSPEDAVAFSGNIRGVHATRAGDAAWDPDDAIGIYMVEAGGRIGIHSLAENRKYTTVGQGRFRAGAPADAICFPPDGAVVDFIAYYPQAADLHNHLYPIDLADQSVQPAIDFLYSANAVGLTKSDRSADLVFEHRLAKVVLKVTDLTGGSLEGMTVSVSGLYTKGSFSLTDGTLSVDGDSRLDFGMKVTDTGKSTAVAEAIVLPSDLPFDYVLAFTIPSDRASAVLPMDQVRYLAGKKYVYEINLTDRVEVGGEGEIGDWEEVPSDPVDIEKEPDEAGEGGSGEGGTGETGEGESPGEGG